MRFCSSSFLVLSTFVIMTGCGGGSNGGSADQGVPDMNSHPDMPSPGGDMTLPRSDAGPATTLSFVAGGLGGNGNVDGVGAAARFTFPYGVALDDAGNLYISDAADYTIRKMVLATGEVTTLAGSPGNSGSSDGVGAGASFGSPQGLAYGVARDGTKNLYVVDIGNITIRAINLGTGMVTTVAGSTGLTPDEGTGDGTGTDARFVGPTGLAIDSSGDNLYVTDTYNYTIRQVNTATWEVTTVAGAPGTSAVVDCTTNCTAADSNFAYPVGLAYQKETDGTESLYIVDGAAPGNVRQVFVADHRVTTLAKQGSPLQFDNPLGVALDGVGNLYISDNKKQVIQQVNISSGDMTIFDGKYGLFGHSDGTGTDATFYGPQLMVPDNQGNLYVADAQNGTIRKIVTSGPDASKVTTVAGAAIQKGGQDGTGDAARFNAPGGNGAGGVTGDGQGNLYVTDTFNNTIRQVVIATGAVTTLAGTSGATPDAGDNGDGTGPGARFNSPRGIAYAKTSDGKGHLYIADSASGIIRQLDIDTGVVTTIAGAAGMPPPRDESGDGTGADARFQLPEGIVSDGQDELYISDRPVNAIRKVVISTRVASTVLGADVGLGSPQGVALDGQGSLYVSDTGHHTILKVTLATGNVATIAGGMGMRGYLDKVGITARFSKPGGLTYDGFDGLYIVESDNHAIRKLNLTNGKVSTLVGTRGSVGVSLGTLPASLNSPFAAAAIAPSQVAILDENSILLAH